MNRLALTMIVKNEEANLERCLRSVQDICQEMIVVDTGSKDRTVEIARAAGARVFSFQWIDDFSAARNYAIAQSRCDWNLVLDADEHLDPESKTELHSFLTRPPAIGCLQIMNRIREEGEEKFVRNSIPRLLPAGVTFQGRVHEQIRTDLQFFETGIRVFHDGYFQTNKFQRNVPLLLKELEGRPDDSYLLKQVAKEYRIAGRYAEAAPFYEKAYQHASGEERFFGPFVVDFLYNLKANGDLERAVQILKEQQDRLGDFSDFHFVLGLLLMDLMEKTGQAELLTLIEQAYRTCLALGESTRYDGVLGTGSFYAAYNLGVYYEVTGNADLAKVYYRQAAELGYERAAERLKQF